jgi:hypothetical protein
MLSAESLLRDFIEQRCDGEMPGSAMLQLKGEHPIVADTIRGYGGLKKFCKRIDSTLEFLDDAGAGRVICKPVSACHMHVACVLLY